MTTNNNTSDPSPTTPPSTGNTTSTSTSTSTYTNVAHRKVKSGTLSLDSRSLRFFEKAVADGDGDDDAAKAMVVVPWSSVSKHQVSPASHPKSMLKIVLKSDGDGGSSNKKPTALTFTLPDRQSLEAIRRDVTSRLSAAASKSVSFDENVASGTGKKRKRPSNLYPSTSSGMEIIHDPAMEEPSTPTGSPKAVPAFTDLAPETLAVTRAALLSNDPALRAQHNHLVRQTSTLSEEDFWSAHGPQLALESARIHGKYRRGMGSYMRSNLDLGLRGRVRLGVEEMRQIFVLYPAVHRAYEEKVPLEMSEEQFWRKYLESAYFYRDRGRIGSTARLNSALAGGTGGGGGVGEDKGDASATAGGGGGEEEKKKSAEQEKEDAAQTRAAAVAGAEDMFSRLDAEMEKERYQQSQQRGGGGGSKSHSTARRVAGRNLAVGQFDLASTANTERSKVLVGGTGEADESADDAAGQPSEGSLVVQKYNRHWAMVLNPDDASAGSDLLQVARRSVAHHVPGDDVAKVNGGFDREMERLVAYADCDEDEADHVKGLGDESFFDLSLRNVEAYSGSGGSGAAVAADDPNRAQALKELEQRRAVFARAMASQVRTATVETFSADSSSSSAPLVESSMGVALAPESSASDFSCPFPPATLGRELLVALTRKMAESSRGEADAQRVARGLPDRFKRQLDAFFRRSSELLRHFFALRRVIEDAGGGGGGGGGGGSSGGWEPVSLTTATSSTNNGGGGCGGKVDKEKQKLSKIVSGMEAVYREMEAVRRDLPQTEEGEVMRKMFVPIMDQLDWAFKIQRDGSAGGGGGFVDVT